MANFGISQNNIPVVNREIENSIIVALEACGLQAERYAKMLCPVDTGLLRNSITHALAGKAPATKSYKADKPDKNGVIKSGTYKGKTPKQGNEHSVYIGSNVEYAIAVEYGDKRHDTGKKHFLTDAATNHDDQYKEIMKLALKGKTSI